MVKIQLDLPNELNKEIKYFMIDKNILDKRLAIIEILKQNLVHKRGKN